MTGWLAALSITGGAVIILLTAASVVRALIVPRGLVARFPLNGDRAIIGVFRFAAGRTSSYMLRDRILSYEGAVRLLGYLAVWLALSLVGYALVYWPAVGSFVQALYAAGSAMFTLGFVPVHGAAPYAIAFVASASGLTLIALQVGYLPSLYAAFNRRETLVTMLSSRTGEPPWGPEVLARHALIANLDDLPQFFRDWELWSADLAESHTNYPVLLAFRSPHPLRHWTVALNAVMDAASLYLALAPARAPSQANAFLRMGYISMREVASVLRIPFDPDPLPEDPIALTYAEFVEAVDLLDRAGFPRERDPESAWPHFRGWRVNYESLVYNIADLMMAPPGLWSGPRSGLSAVYAPQRPLHRHPGEAESHTHAAVRADRH